MDPIKSQSSSEREADDLPAINAKTPYVSPILSTMEPPLPASHGQSRGYDVDHSHAYAHSHTHLAVFAGTSSGTNMGTALPVPVPLPLPIPVASSPYTATVRAPSSSSSPPVPGCTTLGSHESMPDLRVGGYALTEAQIIPPTPLSESMLRLLDDELQHQEANPPALPRSQIPALPPKPPAREWHHLPEGIDANTRRELEAKNNAIAAENQAVERDRNNMAAKKSRQVRLESLHNARRMLADQAAELAWFRMQFAVLAGLSPERAWAAVPVEVRTAMAAEITARVARVDDRNAEQKKREEARKRAADAPPRGQPPRRKRRLRSPSAEDAGSEGTMY